MAYLVKLRVKPNQILSKFKINSVLIQWRIYSLELRQLPTWTLGPAPLLASLGGASFFGSEGGEGGGELKSNLEKIRVNFEIVTGIFDQFLEILGLLSLNFKQILCKIYRKFE